MKKIIENKKVHYFVVLGAVAFGVYAFFFALPTGQAVTNAEIGSVTATLVPSPVLSGTESVVIEFDSNSGVGSLNLSGWSVTDGSSFSYSFPDGTELTDGQTFKVCADSGVETCDAEWVGGEQWADSGNFILNDDTKELFSLGYTVPAGTGKLVKTIYSWVAPVYVHNDKILICHEDNKSSLGPKSVPVGPLLKGDAAGRGHTADAGDIIPPFYYNVGNGTEYYMGKLWPDQKNTYDAGCI